MLGRREVAIPETTGGAGFTKLDCITNQTVSEEGSRQQVSGQQAIYLDGAVDINGGKRSSSSFIANFACTFIRRSNERHNGRVAVFFLT